jgi:hypothetical protein
VESAQVSNAPRCAFTACAIAGARLVCRLSAATVTRSGRPCKHLSVRGLGDPEPLVSRQAPRVLLRIGRTLGVAPPGSAGEAVACVEGARRAFEAQLARRPRGLAAIYAATSNARRTWCPCRSRSGRRRRSASNRRSCGPPSSRSGAASASIRSADTSASSRKIAGGWCSSLSCLGSRPRLGRGVAWHSALSRPLWRRAPTRRRSLGWGTSPARAGQSAGQSVSRTGGQRGPRGAGVPVAVRDSALGRDGF